MNKISFVGSGNVAYHLCRAFKATGIKINSISSKNYRNAKNLSKVLNTNACSIEDIPVDSDLLILAVNDDAISTVLKKIPSYIKNVVHTSGSISLDVFENKFENFGVFYPLQSFNKERDVDFRSIPILIEANNSEFENGLLELAGKISENVRVMDSEARKYLHLAAVFANNFVNFMALESYHILEKQQIDGDLIRPLMIETVLRLKEYHPKDVMTGPAKRKDLNTLKNHEDLLKSDPKLQSLYRQISQLIMQRFDVTEL